MTRCWTFPTARLCGCALSVSLATRWRSTSCGSRRSRVSRKFVGARADIGRILAMHGTRAFEVNPPDHIGGEVRRQNLDHRIVLDPDLDHVERCAIAGHTMPGSLTTFPSAAARRSLPPEADLARRSAIAAPTFRRGRRGAPCDGNVTLWYR